MTRILFLGDMAATGFGTVTTDLGRAMIDNGDDLRFLSLNEQPLGDLVEPFASRTFTVGERGGWIHEPESEEEATIINARIESVFAGGAWPDGWTPEAAIILGDYTAVRRGAMPMVIKNARIPVFHYCPIEGIDLPPRWGEFWRKVRPVAMCEFGADQIERVIGYRPPVVYHGVNTTDFFPVSKERPIVIQLKAAPKGRDGFVQHGRVTIKTITTKEECKEFYGIDPKRTILFRADRHMPRKRYPDLFRALAPILARNPGVDLMYHCASFDQGGDLDDARSKYGPVVGSQDFDGRSFPLFGGVASRFIPYRLVDVYAQSIDRRALNIMYNAADIYISNSSEGFGLTIAEAMAAGVPAIGLGFSSVPEVIGAEVSKLADAPFAEGIGGLIVRIAGLIANPYDHFWASVDEGALGAAAEYLIQHRKRRRELGFLAAGHVQRSFSWATAAQQFHDITSERTAVAA